MQLFIARAAIIVIVLSVNAKARLSENTCRNYRAGVRWRCSKCGFFASPDISPLIGRENCLTDICAGRFLLALQFTIPLFLYLMYLFIFSL